MDELTKEQIDFLRAHDIPLELTYNASGQSKAVYHDVMKSNGKIVAYNVTPCNAFGHTLRTRNGHCIQCDTAKIAFIKRAIAYGVIYIAGSVQGQVIKVGFTQSKSIREESLNRTKYAGYNDWEILYSASSINASEIENLTHTTLAKYGISAQYYHDDHEQTTYEIFSCSYEKAKQQLDQAINNNEFSVKSVVESRLKLHKYQFRNLIRRTK